MKFKDASEDIIYEEDVGGGISPFKQEPKAMVIFTLTPAFRIHGIPTQIMTNTFMKEILTSVSKRSGPRSCSGNYSGSSVYGTTVEYEDPEDKTPNQEMMLSSCRSSKTFLKWNSATHRNWNWVLVL